MQNSKVPDSPERSSEGRSRTGFCPIAGMTGRRKCGTQDVGTGWQGQDVASVNNINNPGGSLGRSGSVCDLFRCTTKGLAVHPRKLTFAAKFTQAGVEVENLQVALPAANTGC